MKRLCSNRRGCSNVARPGGRYCRGCATIAMRRHRAEGKEKRRTFTADELVVRRARAYVAQYVKRGRLEKKSNCEACGRTDVGGYWKDPTHPLEVQWLCPECRATRRELQDERAVVQAELAELRDLPAEIRARLHAEAQQGLGGPPGTLRYTIALKLAHRRYLAEQAPFYT